MGLPDAARAIPVRAATPVKNEDLLRPRQRLPTIPIAKRLYVGRNLDRHAVAICIQCLHVQPAGTDNDRNVLGKRQTDRIAKTAPISLVLAKLVDDQQIGVVFEGSFRQRDCLLKRLGIKATPAGFFPQRLRNADGRSRGQDLHVHVAVMLFIAFGVDLDGSAKPQATASKIFRQFSQQQISGAPVGG